MVRQQRESAARMAVLLVIGFVFATTLFATTFSTTSSAATKPAIEHAAKRPAKSLALPGEYLVQTKVPVKDWETAALAHRFRAEVIDRVRSDILLLRVQKPLSSKSTASDEILAQLRENPLTRFAEPNYRLWADQLPDDPELASQWAIRNTGGRDAGNQRGIAGIDIGAEAAWKMHTGSRSVVVAVIDTGVDFSHPDLKAQAWVNTAEKYGEPGVDDDGNGYVDDVNGFNFVAGTGDVSDDVEHGTHCAGIIGASGNNGIGVVGVNWKVSLMAVKFLGKKGSGSTAGAIKSVDYARTNGAMIMNNSWSGGARSELLATAIEDAEKAGILFVASAGNNAVDNDMTETYPSNYDFENVIAVAAADNRGALADFSNYGEKNVDVAAPGVNIVSTLPGNRYGAMSGTSMAGPYVAGIAALMLAQQPNLTYRELKRRLIASSRPLYDLDGKVASAGMVDAGLALAGKSVSSSRLKNPSDFAKTKAMAVSSPHPFGNLAKYTKTIRIPGAKQIALRFQTIDTERNYDRIWFFNGQGESLGGVSGTKPRGWFSPVADGDSITILMNSDITLESYGFDIDAAAYE